MKALTILAKSVKAGLVAGSKLNLKKQETPLIPDASFDYTAKARGKYFSVGFGKEPIMPTDISKRKYYIAGYGMYKPAEGILDTLFAHAIWIDDKSSKGGVVLVSLDAVGMLNQDVLIMRKYLKPFCEKTGCRSVNIMCTHDHAGIDTMGIWGALPKTGRTKEFMEIVRDGIISACEKAYAGRRDGILYHGTIEVPDLQEDIRLPKVYSKTLTRFRFAPSDGSKDIYMLNFAAHPETLSSPNTYISADYVAYCRQEIYKQTGCETIFFVGAIGGMITMDFHGKTMPERIEITKNLGRRLGEYALSVENEKALEPTISFMRQELYFDAENSTLMLFAKLDILKVAKYYSKNSTLGYLLKSEISYFEIGGLKMLFIPGEIFPELVYGGYLSADESAEGLSPAVNPNPLCEILEDENLLLFGLSNDEIGYIIPPNDFLLSDEAPYLDRAVDRLNRRHYEETNSLGPNTAPKIASVVEKMMETVREAKK